MTKSDLIKKVDELIHKVISDDKSRKNYIFLCKKYEINVTPAQKLVRFYCKDSETLTNLEQIINICEISLGC